MPGFLPGAQKKTAAQAINSCAAALNAPCSGSAGGGLLGDLLAQGAGHGLADGVAGDGGAADAVNLIAVGVHDLLLQLHFSGEWFSIFDFSDTPQKSAHLRVFGGGAGAF